MLWLNKNKLFNYYLPLILSGVLMLVAVFFYITYREAIPAEAAVTQTGTNTEFHISSANAGTVSSTITVPADATMLIAGISGYGTDGGSPNFFSGGSMTFTKGGVDTAMTAVQPSTRGDGNTCCFMSAMFYMVNPDTGSNKTLKWDWLGANTSTNAPIISITFWKGVDTANPVRGSGGGQNSGFPYTTNTITAQSGDAVVAWAGWYKSVTAGSIDSWSNLTELADPQTDSNLYRVDTAANGAWATGSPSGNTTVAASTGNGDDGGIVAIALIPASTAQTNVKIRAGGTSGNGNPLVKIRGGSPNITQIETVKVDGCNSPSVGTCVANFTTATTQGELVVVVVFSMNQGALPISVTDSQGNTYTALWSEVSGDFHHKTHLYYLSNAPSGITSVTVTLSNSVNTAGVVVGHYTGVSASPLDANDDPNTLDNSPSWTSGSISTSQANTLLIGTDLNLYVSAPNSDVAASGNWTQDQKFTSGVFDGNNGNSAAYAHQIVSSAGSYANTGTNPAGTSENYPGIAAFKGSVGSVKFR